MVVLPRYVSIDLPLVLLVVGTTTLASATTAAAAVASATSDPNSNDGCPLWDINDGWIVSGKSVLRNESVPGLIQDIMIPWKQHSARSFLRWKRHYYFFTNPIVSDNDDDDGGTEYIFAPGYKYPLECHKYHANLDVNYTEIFTTAYGTKRTDEQNNNAVQLNPPIQPDRTIAVGDPIFLPCSDPTLSAMEDYDKFLPIGMSTTDLKEKGDYCINKYDIYIKEVVNDIGTTGSSKSTDSQTTNKYYGTFTNTAIKKDTAILWGVFVPMHQSELYNPKTKSYELLYNYCYSPSRINYTSPLLLLPIVPGANGINHADSTKQQTPNVALSWMEPEFDPEEFFTDPTEILFGSSERTSDSPNKPPLLIEYVTLRDIQPGEELLLDYGIEWENAYHEHLRKQEQLSKEERLKEENQFRYPIGIPEYMIPTTWLEKERIVSTYREWETPTLQVGELQRMQLTTVIDDSSTDSNVPPDTRQIQGMVDRIGLPVGMSEFLAKWADEMGITNVLRQHVRKELQLPPEGERRLRLNGTTWWVKRFPENWRSDMHYISPDDFASNQMFMNALADAGYDTILNAVGTRDNLTSITVYYPSYIAVSHCTTAFMHNDSEEDGHYNVIFPVLQVNNSKPELIVGDEESDLYAPYKYETDHAVVLGKLGEHGTAPCDYRGTDSMRMVVSVYMVDSDNIPTRDKVLREWVNADPPYPRVADRLNFLQTTKHWKRDDPTRTLRHPLASEKETSVQDEL